jgi:hypothetical protein
MSELEKLDKSVLNDLLGTGELHMVGFGSYDVGLFFQTGLNINIGTSCKVRSPDGVTTTWEPERNLGDLRMFAPIVKEAIKSYRVTSANELILTFTNAYELILIEHGGHESFLIAFPDGSQLPI